MKASKRALASIKREKAKRAKIRDNLVRALDSYTDSQRGQVVSANNVTLVVVCTQLKCLLKELN